MPVVTLKLLNAQAGDVYTMTLVRCTNGFREFQMEFSTDDPCLIDKAMLYEKTSSGEQLRSVLVSKNDNDLSASIDPT